MNKISELEGLIVKHKALYYQGRPEISDHEYDAIEDELRALSPKSYALEIVGSVIESTNKVKHDKKMLSLGKTYKESELLTWLDKHEAISMFKIDGVSCSLLYENGNLLVAKTRGDGSFGENITLKANWIDSIPKKIKEMDKIEVRGEIFCIEEDFFHLSEEMIKTNLEKPTSLRNIVAGLISRKDRLELNRYLTFQAFDYISEDRSLSKEIEKFDRLRNNGFVTPEISIHKNSNNINEVIDTARSFMSEGEYQIDGIVFSYNNLELHEELGETAHHPRYKMAFKFQGESKVTTIEQINWGVSRNGILTPVADVAPVDLSGATISKVTLHNYGMVKQYNLKKGDEIEIIRSGEVIPKFLSVVNESSNPFEVPNLCSSCGEKTTVEDIRILCKNEFCPGVVKESILNFIQKIGIEDLSSKRLDEMLRVKLIKTIEDLYKLSVDDLMTLDKVKDKLATKLINSIEKSKSVDLITFLSALGISGGAYNKCEKVVMGGNDSIEDILSLSIEKLMSIDSFAEKSATEFHKSITEKKRLIVNLLELGFSFEKIEKKETPISGKKICITGSLSEKRSVIEGWIRDAGGLTTGSVSKNTDLLLTNDTEGSSSKYKKAVTLGVEIINEEKLKELLF